jgi:hypothetical protein
MSEAKEPKAIPKVETRSVAAHGAGLKGRQKHIYAAARVLYGWALQEHHYPSDPINLTDAEFAEALKRAAKFPGVELLDAAKSKLLGA